MTLTMNVRTVTYARGAAPDVPAGTVHSGLKPSWRTSRRLVERRGARASGRNFLKLHAFIPNSQDAEPPHQNLAFGDGVNLFPIGKKSEARRTDGRAAKAIELYIARQGQRRRRGWKLGTLDLVFRGGMRDGRSGSLYWAKRIAAGTLVIRLAGAFDLAQANLEVLNAEDEIVLEIGDICNHWCATVIPHPYHGRDYDQKKEDADLLPLLHAAVRKCVFTCKSSLTTLAGPLFSVGRAGVKDSRSAIRRNQ